MVSRTHHLFMPDPTAANWRGEPSCAVCPMPRKHEIHDVPAPADDVSARVLGERDETENE